MKISSVLPLITACLAAGTGSALTPTVAGHDVDPLNVPLFAKPGQTRLAVAFGQKGEGAHVNGGIAVSQGVELLAAGSFADLNNCPSCNISERRHIEVGFGAYAVNPETGRIREIAAGVAQGRFRMSGAVPNFDPEAQEMRVTASDYREVFLQADLGRRFKWIDRAGSIRLAGYRYEKSSLVDGNGLALPMAKSAWGVYLEPAYSFRVGYKGMKVDTQWGLSLPVLQPEGFGNNLVWASLGLGFDLFTL